MGGTGIFVAPNPPLSRCPLELSLPTLRTEARISQGLREQLLGHLAAGSLPPARLLAVLKELGAAPGQTTEAPSLQSLLDALVEGTGRAGASGQAFRSLHHDVLQTLLGSAQEVYARRARSGPLTDTLRQRLAGFELEPLPPPPWPGRAYTLRQLPAVLQLVRDRNYLDEHGEALPELRQWVAQQCGEGLQACSQAWAPSSTDRSPGWSAPTG